jgi:peptidoglycan/LPS O-acetylase OafA/YrhL
MSGHFIPGYFSMHVGWTGVDLFFVLSGFFVSGILFREYIKQGKMRGGRFFVRRIFKIWPLFYASFFIHLLYFHLKHTSPSFSKAITEIFFVQDYLPGFMGITWSLGIEEQFYLLLAILLPWAASTLKVKWVVPACIAIIITCPILRIIHYYSFWSYSPLRYHFPLHLRADSLSAGILISWYYHFQHDKFRQWVAKRATLLFFLSIIFLSPTFIFPFFDKWIFTVGYTSIWLGYSGIVVLCIFLPSLKNTWDYVFNQNKLALLIAWIGFYSYAIYLFHLLIGPMVQNNLLKYIWKQAPLNVRFLVFLTANILFGYVISTLIEQPILKWRDKVLPSK